MPMSVYFYSTYIYTDMNLYCYIYTQRQEGCVERCDFILIIVNMESDETV